MIAPFLTRRWLIRADALTWIVAAVSLGTAGLAASLIPALRATRADPIIAMRAEQ